jgi:3-dehydroquinate synthase
MSVKLLAASLTKLSFETSVPVVKDDIEVKNRSGSYKIRVGPGLLAEAGTELAKLKLGKKAAIIADESVAKLYADRLQQSLKAAGFEICLSTLAGGETSKDMSRITPLLSFLARNKVERNDTVLAFGGGVLGDLAGFVAAIYLRGVNLVHLPSTLLAMVDSSVGGKTGVNLPEGKNLAGVFHPPQLVLSDTDTLKTLQRRELTAGLAEVIKYGIIADAELFAQITDGAPADLTPVIMRCVKIKARVVEADEHETTGERALLNFGHTLGHAIERVAGYGKYLHGEAVAVGIHAATLLSQRTLGLPAEDVEAIKKTLVKNGLPLQALGLNITEIKQVLAQDKKVMDGVNRWVLSPKIGKALVTSKVKPADVDAVIEEVLTSKK